MDVDASNRGVREGYVGRVLCASPHEMKCGGAASGICEEEPYTGKGPRYGNGKRADGGSSQMWTMQRQNREVGQLEHLVTRSPACSGRSAQPLLQGGGGSRGSVKAIKEVWRHK